MTTKPKDQQDEAEQNKKPADTGPAQNRPENSAYPPPEPPKKDEPQPQR